MSELLLPPHQLIASDEYWKGSIEQPSGEARFGDRFIDEFRAGTNVALLSIYSQYEKSATNGSVVTPIHAGQELSQLAWGSGLLKIIIDTRSEIRDTRKSRKNTDSPDTFDELAEQMSSDKHYKGPGTLLVKPSDNEGKAIRITRNVIFLTGSYSEKQLEGIDSGLLDEKEFSISINESPLFGVVKFINPKMVIGQSYQDTGKGKTVKVVSADALVPDKGNRGKKIRKTKETRQKAYKPRLALG